MLHIEVNKLKAKRTNCEPLASGMVGAQIEVTFDSSWDGYAKTAVFKNDVISKDVIEAMWQDGNIITIPAEVLATPYQALSVGFYGFKLIDNEPETLPTVYAVVGVPMNGADPTEDISTDSTLPVYAQLQWQIDHFEISEEQISEAVAEYLAEHPVEIRPATANTLGGVKVGNGLSVTSDGTLSAQTAPVSSVNGKTGAVNLVPSDLGIGSVFTLKGSKPTYADLPATGNTIGDVWYVVADSVGYIWLNDGTVDRWEQLGMEIDLSAYRTASAQDVIDAGKLSTSGGTVTGDIRMGATVMTRGKITMLADPTTNYDAVNKGYADGHYAEKSDLDDYVAISQGVAHAGKFLVVGDDGNVTTISLAVWQGGSY